MSVLFWGIGLVALAFVVHLIWWRIHLPERQTKVFLMIFFATLFAGGLVLYLNPETKFLGVPAPVLWTEFLRIAILFTGFTLAYMITYSGMEADSPTLVMVSAIHKAGPKGLTIEAFEKKMTDELLMIPRVQDLILDKMATLEEGRYCLTVKGRSMARLFEMYRNLLKAGKGG